MRFLPHLLPYKLDPFVNIMFYRILSRGTLSFQIMMLEAEKHARKCVCSVCMCVWYMCICCVVCALWVCCV